MQINEIQKKYGRQVASNDGIEERLAILDKVASKVQPMASQYSVLTKKIDDIKSGLKQIDAMEKQRSDLMRRMESEVSGLDAKTKKSLKDFLNRTLRNPPKIKGL